MSPRRARIGAIALTIVVLLAGAYVARSLLFSGAATPTRPMISETIVVRLINQRRVSNGLRPLAIDPQLHALALGHTEDMVAQGFFAHDTPHGRTFAQRAARLHRRETGETIAWGTGGYGKAASLVSLWMASPEHRRILLDPHLRRVGVGIVVGVFEGQAAAHVATADFST